MLAEGKQTMQQDTDTEELGAEKEKTSLIASLAIA